MMHIAIIADSIDKQSAGIHYYTRNLIIHLLNHDLQNKYTVIKLNETKIKEGIHSIHLPNTLWFLKDDPIRTFYTLPKLIRKINPDIVIEPAHFGPFNLPKHIKRITIIHDLTPILYPKLHKFRNAFLQKLFLPHIIKKADHIVTNSKNTTSDLVSYFPKSKSKTTTISLGKAKFFRPSDSEKIIQKYKIDKPYFLNVGTIEPRKNLKKLLEAYQLFREKSALKTKLVICGNIGWKSKSFFKQYFKHPFEDDIKLIGYAERLDLPYLYTQAEAFVYPSLYEGFGLPVLEAMACGCPVIISDNSSLLEVGGEAALYFNPNSASQISQRLIEISNDQRFRIKLQQASLKQAEKFSWSNFAIEFIELFVKLSHPIPKER